MRLIDADALLKAMDTWDKFGFSHSGAFVREPENADYVPYVRYGDMVKCVEGMPTADVVERKRGKWKVYNILDYAQRPTGRKILRCPFCGYLTDEFMSRVDYYHKLTHFCPNCGAEMEGSNAEIGLDEPDKPKQISAEFAKLMTEGEIQVRWRKHETD